MREVFPTEALPMTQIRGADCGSDIGRGRFGKLGRGMGRVREKVENGRRDVGVEMGFRRGKLVGI
jgi:hypothetical protein